MTDPPSSAGGAPAVTCERLAGHVALVTLNRPQARNAVDSALAHALEAIVHDTERDPEVRAVVPAALAYRHGLVNRLVPGSRVVDEALALARRITRNAPVAVRESLRIARQAVDLDDAALCELSKQSRRRIEATEDYQEGPRAFVEKREPRWMGR